MFDWVDTSLIPLLISKISQDQNWPLEEALERFYESKLCKDLSREETGLYVYSHVALAEMFDEELKGIEGV